MTLTETKNEDNEIPAVCAEFNEVPDPLISKEQASRVTVNLGLELGRVRLPLSEWVQVGPGSVLMLDGVAVGEAYLTDAEGVVAFGELVDVEGMLGFRIKRWRGVS